MATHGNPVLTTTEARASLGQIVAEFAREGSTAEPVAFGSHGRPQGVIVPWELWLEVLPAVEEALDAAEARERLEAAGGERASFDEAAKQLGRGAKHFR
jgi:hypothetical protein